MFPQYSKPHIIDFRDHKMALSGFASRGVFRKHLSDRTKKSKYATIAKTRAQLDAEEEQKKQEKVVEAQRAQEKA